MLLRWFLALSLALVAFAQDVVPGRFIVELTGEPAIAHQDRSRRRVEIQSEQQSLERALRTRRATVRARVDTVVNALIVNAPDGAALANLPGVRRVEPVRRIPPLAFTQLANHEVPAAWEIIGGIANAGAGVKIGILDSGIDITHPGFSAEGMTAPDGFPQASPEANLNSTNGKVIVARAFDGGSIEDTTGHGTGVAMAAAGVQHVTPTEVIISGVAPAAWLGVYRVSNREDSTYHTDDILLGLDAAVRDGMDVVNLSFGAPGYSGAAYDSIFASGTFNAMNAGVLVVHAAGNTPGAQTVDDAASAEKEIAVGANSAASAPSVIPSFGSGFPAQESSNITTHEPISGPLVDTENLDGNLLGCDPFPSDSLAYSIALIRRGGCDFAVKLFNAAASGAIAAIVYNSPEPSSGTPEDLVYMGAGDTPLPALFIANSSGNRLRYLLQTVEDFTVQMRFPGGIPNAIASFSSQGPSIEELGIKPDLVATGTSFYTAAIKGEPGSCPLCDPSGYTTVNGTSFSAPMTAGAAAVIKSARPGLTSDEYRSLLVNSASPMILANGSTANVMSAGSGILNLKNAVTSTIAAAPVSLSFGSGDGTVDRTKSFTLKNLSADPATWNLSIDSTNDTRPVLSAETLTIGPGESVPVQLAFSAAGLAAGTSQGFVKVEDTNSGVVARIPYWYAVTGGDPATLVLLRTPETASPGQPFTLIVRIHDVAGLPLPEVKPVVTPMIGEGTVNSVTQVYPNSWRLSMTPGQPGTNTFRITYGDASYTYGINAK